MKEIETEELKPGWVNEARLVEMVTHQLLSCSAKTWNITFFIDIVVVVWCHLSFPLRLKIRLRLWTPTAWTLGRSWCFRWKQRVVIISCWRHAFTRWSRCWWRHVPKGRWKVRVCLWFKSFRFWGQIFRKLHFFNTLRVTCISGSCQCFLTLSSFIGLSIFQNSGRWLYFKHVGREHGRLRHWIWSFLKDSMAEVIQDEKNLYKFKYRFL